MATNLRIGIGHAALDTHWELGPESQHDGSDAWAAEARVDVSSATSPGDLTIVLAHPLTGDEVCFGHKNLFAALDVAAQDAGFPDFAAFVAWDMDDDVIRTALLPLLSLLPTEDP